MLSAGTAGVTAAATNSIVLNALSETWTAGGSSGFFVKPIRPSTDTTSLQYLAYNATSGEIVSTPPATRRLSVAPTTDAEDIQEADAARVWDLRPVTYRDPSMLDEAEAGQEMTADYKRVYGFVAEEVAAIDPRLVHWDEDEDGKKQAMGVDLEQLVPLLLHQTKARIEEVKARYESRIKALEEKLDALLN